MIDCGSSWFQVKGYYSIITDEFTDKEIRSIAIGNLSGISKSTQSDYMVFHWERDFDEMLEVGRKDDIIDMTKRVYSTLTKKNLPIFEINEKKLDDYVTSQSDADEGISKMPDRSLRIKSERLVHDSESSEEEQEVSDGDKENQNDHGEDYIKKTPPKRNKNDKKMIDLYNKSDAIGIEQKDMNKGLSEMIFSKKKNERKGRIKNNKEDVRKFRYNLEDLNIIEEQIEEVEVFNDDDISFEKIDYDEEKEYNPKLEDFKIIKVLDKGSFGKVFLVENKFNGKYYAMKRIRKDVLIEKNKQIENTKNEKQILLNLEHPFLLGMSYVIQNDLRIYFFLDYIEGGNLYQNLFKVKRFPEQTVKFFAAQLVMAFGFLHDEMIVHRDLKPENVLLGSDGYLKLADFGLAKSLPKSDPLTYSYCGTTEYLAPEIIKDYGHSFTVDWWTLGILLYELRTGRTPFLHKTTHQTTKLIRSGKIIFPDPVKHKIDMSEDMKDIITQLLQKEPTKRLGHNSKKEVMKHPWFKDIDWK